jgi:hypothetical protein
MKKLSESLAVILAVLMIFSFSACGSKEEPTIETSKHKTTTSAKTVTKTVAVTDADGKAVTDANGKAVTETVTVKSNATGTTAKGGSSSSGETTTAKSGGSAVTTKKSSNTATTAGTTVKQYNTVSEILAFYKSAANPLKSSSTSSATKTREKITTISGSIPSLYQSFGFKEKDDTTAVKVEAGSMKDKFPVEKQSYVCNLSDSDVASASCTYSNGTYNITINVKDDSEGTYDRSSKCVSTISVPIGTWTCKGVAVKAAISGGKLVTLYYSMPTYVSSGSNAFAFNLEQWWTVDSQ